MSNLYNDIFVENLYERLAGIDQVTVGVVEDFNRYIAENDLEGAQALVEAQEAIYATDL